MSLEWARKQCLELPHATEDIKWETNLVFSVGEKMFAIVALEPRRFWISFKCSDSESLFSKLAWEGRLGLGAWAYSRAR